jgi:hypothetical protein
MRTCPYQDLSETDKQAVQKSQASSSSVERHQPTPSHLYKIRNPKSQTNNALKEKYIYSFILCGGTILNHLGFAFSGPFFSYRFDPSRLPEVKCVG